MSRPPDRFINSKYATSFIAVKFSFSPATFATTSTLFPFFFSYFSFHLPPPLHSSTYVPNEYSIIIPSCPNPSLPTILPYSGFISSVALPSFFAPQVFFPLPPVAPPLSVSSLFSPFHLISLFLLPFPYPSGLSSTLDSFSLLISFFATTALSFSSGNSAIVSLLTYTDCSAILPLPPVSPTPSSFLSLPSFPQQHSSYPSTTPTASAQLWLPSFSPYFLQSKLHLSLFPLVILPKFRSRFTSNHLLFLLLPFQPLPTFSYSPSDSFLP